MGKSSIVEFLKDLTEKGGGDRDRRKTIKGGFSLDEEYKKGEEREREKKKRQVRNVIKLHPRENKSHFQRS